MFKSKTILTLIVLCVSSASANENYESPGYRDDSYTNEYQPSSNPRTLSEVREQLIGRSIFFPNIPLESTLVGQYLRKTGAKTITRSFLTAPAGNVNPPSKQGPARLVVPVSAKTFADFSRLFNNANMLYLYYEPNGSMQGAHLGKRGNYANLVDDVRYTAPGTLMVPVVLSDSEASRVTHFFDLGRDEALNSYAQRPWLLKNFDRVPKDLKVYAKYPNLKPWITRKLLETPEYSSSYSADTGFDGCTHWFSNIPLGDRLVDTYIFPRGPEDETGNNPRHQPLMPYYTPGGLTAQQENLLRSVWTYPGHQQLGEVLDPAANRRGEFTNVGWIAYSLLGSQSLDRVPVVFLFVDDVTQKIDPNFRVQIRQQ